MFAYVARQPIFNTRNQLYAYELLFRDGEANRFPDISPDEATSRVISSTHLSLGLEAVIGHHLAFINFHQSTLIHHFPRSLDPAHTVVEILETVDINVELIEACRQLKKLGYQIALDDYDLDSKWDPFLTFVSIIKFDIRETPYEKIAALAPKLKARGIRLLAEKVETQAEFNQYSELGFDYFQGYYLAKPEVIRHKQFSANQLTMLELMNESASITFDLRKINRIIERDPALTFQLLRYINNPLINKRNKISSLHHALTYMGEAELRKFIALLALSNMSKDEPNELLVMSLVRAKFCEHLCAITGHCDINAGFLVGLLSLLDALIKQPMEELVEKIPLDEDVQQALCKKPGWLRHCVQLIICFEQGQWNGVKRFAMKYRLNQSDLHECYSEALNWVNHIHTPLISS
ncbi:EAL and HDOD domain-containing protein [Salinimonas chungwhensis]|uniref:EAL and HDOD domain-containing protein n=1 Tax=Salinimonas chungwhensis TaxID=265425 RepID=UPI00036C1443|nr:HDOD domain-containing protein [Salinimonas chungwhensis]